MTATAAAPPEAETGMDGTRLSPMAGTLCVDARAIAASGIGRYLRELLTCWLQEPPFARLALMGAADVLDAVGPRDAGLGGSPAIEVIPHAGGFYSLTAQRSWLAARRDPRVARAAACFFPHWDAPVVRRPAHAVVTVHDLTHFQVPDAFPAHKRMVASHVLRRVVAGARRLVCVSDATARDVGARFPAARVRISTVPNGGGERFAGRAGAPPVAGPYLLVVGNQKPHKNLGAALGVLARLRADGDDALRLVVIGREFVAGDAVLAAARRAGVADRVVALGACDDATLHAAYAGAEAFVFPSRYEGFGLPLLEAMAAGAPVVASNASAVREVVGAAAPTFAPDDVAGMAAAVRALRHDRVHREAAIAAGRDRAARFSWRLAARRTGRILQAASVDSPVPVSRSPESASSPVILPA